MKYCLALVTSPVGNLVVNEERYPHLLNTFAYPKTLTKLEFKPDFLIIDSGAFSVWKSGQTISVQDYARYAAGVQHRADRVVFVNLDVIPGAPGAMPEPREVEAAMAGSVSNADYLRRSGLRVMEVFHQGEPFEFLDFLLSRLPKDEILCIAPRNDISVSAKVAWLREVLRHLLQTRTPQELPRFHGLASTAPDVMRSFPFYSVDSSSWSNAIRFGGYLTEKGSTKKIHTELPSSRPHVVQRSGLRRSVQNCVRVERDMTHLWETRGIVWAD